MSAPFPGAVVRVAGPRAADMIRLNIAANDEWLNPAIPKCFYCNEDKNEIILAGRLPDDTEALHGRVLDMEPCQKCRELMSRGVILISVTPERPVPHGPMVRAIG